METSIKKGKSKISGNLGSHFDILIDLEEELNGDNDSESNVKIRATNPFMHPEKQGKHNTVNKTQSKEDKPKGSIEKRPTKISVAVSDKELLSNLHPTKEAPEDVV